MSGILLEGTAEGERLKLAGAGAWTAENARSARGADRRRDPRRAGPSARVDIDMAAVERLDTFGAWLLERLVRGFAARGCDTEVIGLPGRLSRADRRGARRQAANRRRRSRRPVRSPMRSPRSARASSRSANRSPPSSRCWARSASRCCAWLMRPRTLPLHLDGASARPCRLARGADHPADHLPDRLHHRAAGHLPFPQVRRRHLRRRHGRHPGAARARRADRVRSWWPAARAAPTPPSSAR